MIQPSVTQVIGPYINKEWFRQEHLDRGNAVHGAAKNHLLGLWVPKLEPSHQPYYDSFRRWADMAIDKVILVETRLFSKMYNFHGKPDLICILKGETHPALVDWKTSQAFFKWWIIQGQAYRHLAQEDKGIVTHKGLSLRLKKDGSGALADDYSERNYSADWIVFQSHLNTYHFYN